MSELKLSFQSNQGQDDPQVKFSARLPSYSLFLTSAGATLSLLDAKNSSTAYLRMNLAGANASAAVDGVDRLPGVSNYFRGNQPEKWQKGIPNFSRVRYSEVYPGVDMVYYGSPRRLEYDFILRPGADPNAIRLKMEGADSLAIHEGELDFTVGGHTLRMETPAIYQEIGGKRREVAGRYKLVGGGEVGFELAAYDAGEPLTIDPVLIYSTYLGGSGDEDSPLLQNTYGVYGAGIAVDGAGNAYVTGYTTSAGFPGTTPIISGPQGSSDAFVVKIDPTGTNVLYSTFIGGSGDEDAMGIAVDSAGNAYITGFTSSVNFPTTPGAYRIAPYTGDTDAFVTKLSTAGSVAYSSYLGGNGTDIAYGIAVDNSGNAYVAGLTSSTNYPSNGYQRSIHGQYNAFVTKFNANGTGIVYSTYLGGALQDYAAGIAVDSSGNAYVAGATVSSDFPTTSGSFDRSCGSDGKCNANSSVGYYFDGFVSKLNAAGSGLVYSTFLGGAFDDFAAGIAVDAAGSAFVTGSTSSSDFRTTPGAFQTTFRGTPASSEAFVAKLNAAGSGLVYSTFLGGSGGDAANGITIDGNGAAYVTGSTSSTDFPMSGAPIQSAYGGATDVFLSKVDPQGATLPYSVYFGGSSGEIGLAVAADAQGNAYITGVTASTDFPILSTLDATLSGTTDAFVAKIRESSEGAPTLAAAVNAASFDASVPLSPGGLATVFGSGLASANPGGSIVTLNGVAAPLYFVGQAQINFQVPWELAGQSTATLLVTTDGVPGNRLTVNLASPAPGIFAVTRSDGATNQGAVLISNTATFAAPVGSIPGATSRPANRGEFITIYCTGLGPVSNQPATGGLAPSNPLSFTTATPVVTVLGSPSSGAFGDVPAVVSFAGLSPGFAGLYQVDVQVPQNALSGIIQLKLSIGGQTANIVTIAVQ